MAHPDIPENSGLALNVIVYPELRSDLELSDSNIFSCEELGRKLIKKVGGTIPGPYLQVVTLACPE